MPRFTALACSLLLALGACGNTSSPTPIGGTASGSVTEPALPPVSDTSALKALPAKDLVGYLTGGYHTGGNNPAMYVDAERKLFVMMGKHGAAELPLADPAGATAAFEAFLLQHGYAANGKTPQDEHAHVMVDGKEMVVMSTDELFPEMPPELRAHFTAAQSDVLYHMLPAEGFALVAAKAPLMWAYTQTIVVLGPGGIHQEFPVAKAKDAFAAFRKLLGT